VSAPEVLVSLHDVSPRHALRCREILSWLKEQGVPPVALLVVPNFHGQWPLHEFPDFVSEISQWAEAGHELVLHGCRHIEEAPPPGGELDTRLRRRFLTGGEGEFLALSPEEVQARLNEAMEIWNRCGLPVPEGFIPPAWLHNANLDPVLAELGIRWTENHAGVRRPCGAVHEVPVISWASRDPLRRMGSRLVCPSLELAWRPRPVLRIAIHPHDFDWRTLRRSIDAVMGRVARRRQFLSYSDFAARLPVPA